MTDNVFRPLLTCLISMQVLATVGQALIISAAVPAMTAPFGGTQMMAQQPIGYGVQQSPGVWVPTGTGAGFSNALAAPMTGLNGVVAPMVSVPMVPLALIIPSAGFPADTNDAGTPQAMPPPDVAPDDSAPEPAAPEAADEAARTDELSSNPLAARTQLAPKAP